MKEEILLANLKACFDQMVEGARIDLPVDKLHLEEDQLWGQISLVDNPIYEALSKRAEELKLILKEKKLMKKGKKAKKEKERKTTKEIIELERENIGEKPWELRGEVSARERPAGSLLGKNVVFDRKAVSKERVPEEREEEDLISILRQRIMEKRFDNVVPMKEKKTEIITVEEPLEEKTLVEEYEQEKKHVQVEISAKIKKKQEEDHRRIKELYRRVCKDLEGLSEIG
eukprot:GHVN01088506.1.p2 GENE.GHVN01088506.1~~GHVN01088506.1.p2  ORF type:complete len:229 (+),score=52.13 GHVN01088506.1:1023-1709(+)